ESPVTSVGWRSGVHWMREAWAPLIEPAIAREHGLRRAGDVLQEHVPAAHERGHDELDLLPLPVHDGLDVVEQAFGDRVRRSQIVGSHPRTSRRKPIWVMRLPKAGFV